MTRRLREVARLGARRPRERLASRVAQLYGGLVLYGVSDALLVRARLGLDPWDVLHQGLSRRLGLSIGTWSILVGAAVLLLWIPLRQRPGIGTVSNVVVIGSVLDCSLGLLPVWNGLAPRALALGAGIVLNGLATGAYVAAEFGPGPRDGLMVGLARRGCSLRLVRTGIEVVAIATGWLLGGDVGVGTLLYAVAIGPLTQFFLHGFGFFPRADARASSVRGPAPGPPPAKGRLLRQLRCATATASGHASRSVGQTAASRTTGTSAPQGPRPEGGRS